MTRSFDVFFDLLLNKRLSKQSWGWWFETPAGPLWRHCEVRHGVHILYNLGPLFNKKTPFYGYKHAHYKSKTVWPPSLVYKRAIYTKNCVFLVNTGPGSMHTVRGWPRFVVFWYRSVLSISFRATLPTMRPSGCHWNNPEHCECLYHRNPLIVYNINTLKAKQKQVHIFIRITTCTCSHVFHENSIGLETQIYGHIWLCHSNIQMITITYLVEDS